MSSQNSTTVLEYFLTPSPELLKIKLFIWSFVLPPICLVGIVTNVLNVVVFYSLRQSKNKLYLYFLAHSACDLLYLLICFVYFAFKTCLSERYSSFYWVVAYELVFFYWIATLLANIIIFLELSISLKRLTLVINFNLNTGIKFWMLFLIICLVSVFILLPMPLTMYIREMRASDNSTTGGLDSPRFQLAFERMRQSLFYQSSLIAGIGFRGLVAPALLLVMTILLSKHLARQLNRKRELIAFGSRKLRGDPTRVSNQISKGKISDEWLLDASEQQTPSTQRPSLSGSEERIQSAKRNLTRMVIAINLLFILSNANNFLATMCVINLRGRPRITEFSSIVSNLTLFIAHACTVLVYYNCDHVFRKAFKATFSRCGIFKETTTAMSSPNL